MGHFGIHQHARSVPGMAVIVKCGATSRRCQAFPCDTDGACLRSWLHRCLGGRTAQPVRGAKLIPSGRGGGVACRAPCRVAGLDESAPETPPTGRASRGRPAQLFRRDGQSVWPSAGRATRFVTSAARGGNMVGHPSIHPSAMCSELSPAPLLCVALLREGRRRLLQLET